jgi:hypothetical protein
VGPDSRAADRSDFSLQRLAVEGLGVWRPAGGAGVELSGRLGVERTQASGGYDPDRPDTDEVFPQSSLVGLGERLRFIRGEAAVTLDRTRIRRNQVLGHRAEVAMASYHGLGATDSGFRSVRADLAAYLPVNIRQALAFRLLAMDHFGERGAGVPFYLLAELGDDDGLRGFRGQRFRDRAMAAVQAEWRWETYYHPGSERVGVEAFVFGDAGMVASSFGELDRSPLRVTPGVGLRAIFTANRLAEGFLAFGGDNVRLSGSLSVTF